MLPGVTIMRRYFNHTHEFMHKEKLFFYIPLSSKICELILELHAYFTNIFLVIIYAEINFKQSF